MENKGCITCRKCEQVRSIFFCGRTRLSQKQLYNKHGFCSDYEPKEKIEKPITNEEWLRQCTTEQLAEFLCNVGFENETIVRKIKSEWVKWLKQPHTVKE